MTKRPWKTALALFAGATALSFTTPATATATQSPAGAEMAECGYYTSGISAYYRHCTNEPYAVNIDKLYNGITVYGGCIQPNENAFIGYKWEVTFAWYNGTRC